MGLARKYLFDVSFDALDPPLAGKGAAVDPASLRAEIDAARAQGLAEGRAAALAEASTTTSSRTAAALETISQDIVRLIDAQKEATAAIGRDAIALVRAVLQNAVPALCRKAPLAEFEALLAHSLVEALDEPRLVLRVADKNFDAVEARLAPAAKAAGYAGKLVLVADASLGDGDGRIEWADGGVERSLPRLMSDLDAMFTRILSEETPDG